MKKISTGRKRKRRGRTNVTSPKGMEIEGRSGEEGVLMEQKRRKRWRGRGGAGNLHAKEKIRKSEDENDLRRGKNSREKVEDENRKKKQD